MLNFLLFIFVSVSITNLVVNATILDIPREFIASKSLLLKKLTSCMMCSGFWIGAFLGMFYGVNIFTGAALSSLFSYLFGTVIDFIDASTALKYAKTEKEIGDIDG